MTSLREHYEENGYVVLPKLIPTDLVDKVVTLYKNDIQPSKDLFFRQNTNRYQKNILNKHGYVQQAFLDIHDYKNHQEFSKATLDIFCKKELHEKLAEVTGFKKFNVMQSMFFDQNAGTIAHQDWWYLDSVPNGNLLGVWIALEDINEKAGKFYMVKKTHKILHHLTKPGMPHSEWQDWMVDYVKQHPKDYVSPNMKKGDVIFWNSGLIHGASDTIDESFSRKSITCHVMPEEYEFGNLFTVKLPKIPDFQSTCCPT